MLLEWSERLSLTSQPSPGYPMPYDRRGKSIYVTGFCFPGSCTAFARIVCTDRLNRLLSSAWHILAALQQYACVVVLLFLADGALAAASLTGALAGGDAVCDAAIRRAGILRIYSLEDLFNADESLSRRSIPAGDRLLIVTNGGGPGVLAAEAAVGSSMAAMIFTRRGRAGTLGRPRSATSFFR